MELEAAVLTALSEHDIPTDVQELLLRGDPSRGIRPMALRAAINAVIEECVQAVPGGNICDPQLIADNLRALKR